MPPRRVETWLGRNSLTLHLQHAVEKIAPQLVDDRFRQRNSLRTEVAGYGPSEIHVELERHIDAFIAAYSYARRLKTLRGLTPFEFICEIWTKEPDRFTVDPTTTPRN